MVYEFLNGPSVPIYFRAERLGDAERVLQGDEEEWSCEAEPEACNALDTYRWLVSVARSCHTRELGFAFHVHSTGPFAVLVVDGAVHTWGRRPELYLSAWAAGSYGAREFAEALRWARSLLKRRCHGLPRLPQGLYERLERLLERGDAR
ncbi:hypothetical protein [Pyrodictium abyssi]|uniref:Uncharacterized protein n=1 Tax=Pyrodictium abyssi TaxID=54256 RepID=A0ABN6ZMZ3_9CREN|nr:hypothetical protein PABY_11980 [Pyrodictium abyssi]